MKGKTLIERYNEIPEREVTSPKIDFIDELARVSMKSRSTVYNWINGKHNPDAITKKVLADHFQTTPEELFGNN